MTATVIAEIVGVIVQRRLGLDVTRGAAPLPAGYSNATELGTALFTRYAYAIEIAALLLLVAIIAAISLTLRPRRGLKVQDVRAQVAVRADRSAAHGQDQAWGNAAMITLGHMLTLSAVLFALSVAGIFINRKNVLLLLMCIELLLLSANFNFIAFSRFLGQLDGQVFVFFILTVAAAESAIGLAILVVLFRERRSINVEDLDTLRG